MDAMDECPYCNAVIGERLIRYFRGQMPGTYFDYECPECHGVMNVEAVPVPEFILTCHTDPESQPRPSGGAEGEA